MKTSIDAMTQIRDTLVKGDLLCEVVAVGMLDAAIAKQEDAQTVEPAGEVGCDDWCQHPNMGTIAFLPKALPTGTKLFTHPTQVTCQIYGHVVGACGECNTHSEPSKLPENGGSGHCSCVECVKPAKPSVSERDALINGLMEITESPATLTGKEAMCIIRAAGMLAADAELQADLKLATDSRKAYQMALITAQQVAVPHDALVVNLMRLAGLDKHKARECAGVVTAMLSSVPQSAPRVPMTEHEINSMYGSLPKTDDVVVNLVRAVEARYGIGVQS